MKSSEFERLINIHGLGPLSINGARLVLVHGLTKYAAAKQLGIAESTVGRAVARLKRPLCKSCGQVLADKRASISDQRSQRNA